jgi:hypothetical protein
MAKANIEVRLLDHPDVKEALGDAALLLGVVRNERNLYEEQRTERGERIKELGSVVADRDAERRLLKERLLTEQWAAHHLGVELETMRVGFNAEKDAKLDNFIVIQTICKVLCDLECENGCDEGLEYEGDEWEPCPCIYRHRLRVKELDADSLVNREAYEHLLTDRHRIRQEHAHQIDETDKWASTAFALKEELEEAIGYCPDWAIEKWDLGKALREYPGAGETRRTVPFACVDCGKPLRDHPPCGAA